jgi:exodeoxyribonuclease VII large subunit
MAWTLSTPFSLVNITQIVEQWFRTMFSEFTFWFVAEVSQIKHIKSRYYLDLIQFDDQQHVVAKCRAVVFQGTIIHNLIQHTKLSSLHDLKGISLLMSGVCSFHYEYGFSIIIQDISSEYLLGQFEKCKQDNIKLLEDLGIVHNNQQKNLWYPPYHIAIVSSATSEWLKDFVSILDESGYNIQVKLYPTMIHGNEAKVEVYQTLKTIYQDIQWWTPIDMVAIIRGWGWSHGIVWQNDINIAKWICHMPAPVMIAIWHTSDQFLLNQLARFPAKTPSDGAYILIDHIKWYDEQVQSWKQKIHTLVLQYIQTYKTQIQQYSDTILQETYNHLQINKQKLLLLQTQIDTYNPEKILNQGYALVKNDTHRVIHDDINEIVIGDTLYISLKSKELKVIVQDIHEKK